MLEPRSLAVSATPPFDEHSEDGHDDFVDVSGRNNDAKVARESFVAGRAAQRDAEKNILTNLDGLDPNVVGVLH